MKKIKHFSHKHELRLRKKFEEGKYVYCYACQRWFEGPNYSCKDCMYYLHISCAELPAEIQHFFHPSHPLTLHGNKNNNYNVNCNVGLELWMGFTYCCDHCNFKMDVPSAKLQPEIQLSIHPHHPLTLLPVKSHFFCDFCNNRCYSEWGQTFCCKQCNFMIDLNCARMLLNSEFEPIQHVSHEHWLTSDWIESPDRQYCSACRNFFSGATYCCKRCWFFLHKDCAEYPTEFSISLHSDHPLKLHTGISKVRERCDFCNLICRGLTFRCDVCNFKMDFTCASMLIDFIQNDEQEITHYSHHHTLSLSDKKMNDDAHCYVCEKELYDPFYGCSADCDIYLHKSCSVSLTSYYRNLKHIQEKRDSFHKDHNLPLAIVYYNNESDFVRCSVCSESCNGPTYACFLCKFDVHESCLETLKTTCQNPFHKHPLINFQKKNDVSISCSACGEPCFDTTFACLRCKFYFHESCLQLPHEIQHFFHPCPLTLQQKIVKFTCRFCEKSHRQFAFYCERCHFYLDVQCALMFTETFEGQNHIINSSHRHSLILYNKETNDHAVSCYGCGQVISGQIYGCVQQCDFYLHRSCAAAPLQIDHPFHPEHPLTLCYGGKWWCAVSILKSMDKRGKVEYLRHKHFEVLGDNKKEPCCGVCDKSICGPSYDCIRCKFFIHQDCLEPVKEMQHSSPLHDRLIGVPSKATIGNSCDACHNNCSVFSYRCDDTCKKFKMCLHCASLTPSIKFYIHDHHLTFFKKMDDDPRCEVCKSYKADAGSYLRCVQCDISYHLLCVPLPSTIKHKCHIDPLDLEDCFMEDDSGEYYCDACEDKRDPKECVYRCAGCSNYVAHINCVIDEVLLSLSQNRGVKLRRVDRKMAMLKFTIGGIFASCNEDELKEIRGVQIATVDFINDLIEDILSEVESTNLDDILKDLVYSDKKFILIVTKLESKYCEIGDESQVSDAEGDDLYEMEKKFLRLTFCESESEFVNFGDYTVSQNFVPILESTFEKYGDIGADSTLSTGAKTCFLNMFCGSVQSMCNTMVKDVTKSLLIDWLKNFKSVQHAGFKIQFAFDHLYKFAHFMIRITREFQADARLFDKQTEINDLTAKLEELKVELKQHINCKERKSVALKERLIKDIELYWKTVGTGFL